MTVREAREVLAYEDEIYDITEDSPVMEAFASYVVDEIRAASEFKYTIFLKREYVVKEAAV